MKMVIEFYVNALSQIHLPTFLFQSFIREHSFQLSRANEVFIFITVDENLLK